MDGPLCRKKKLFIFLALLNLLATLIIIFSIIHIVKRIKDISDINDEISEDKKIKRIKAYSFCEVIISLYLIIYCFLTMCFTAGLLYYHIKLIINNITTKEDLRKAFNNSQGNIFKRSFWKNVKNVLNPITKKYNILKILRGDIKEICDENNNGNTILKSTEENIIQENETQDMININKVMENTKDQYNSKPLNDDNRYEGNFSNNNIFNKSVDSYNNYNKNIFNAEKYSNSSNNINDLNYEMQISKSVHYSKTISNKNVIHYAQNAEIKNLHKKKILMV